MNPPIELLHELLRLADGCLYWRSSPGPRARAGQEAGNITARGYRKIKIAGRNTASHRIVFAMTHGRWPIGAIDHVNGNKLDNRPENLREATAAQNAMNTGPNKRNSSGYRGVTIHKGTGKWQAQFAKNGQLHYLGLFECPEQANAAVAAGRVAAFGEFSPENSRRNDDDRR